MTEKTIHFISGLPRSGSTLLTNILKQNPNIHGEAVSSLSSLFAMVHSTWGNIEANQEYVNMPAKKGILKSMLHGYFEHIDRNIIIDRNLNWVPLISVVEEVLQRPVKIIACVRNPAEILTSYEKARKQNPLFFTGVDAALGKTSSLIGRAYFYSGPDGEMGMAHRNLLDATIMGYTDRMLFVDYNRYCNTPKAQTRRIYDFLELDNFEHNFEEIVQTEQYCHHLNKIPYEHKIKSSIDKTTTNCVEYLGLDLYEQYNKQIFWDAWI